MHSHFKSILTITGRCLPPANLTAAATIWLAFVPMASLAQENYLDEIKGPVEARVIEIRDGDTIEVEAFVWPMQSVHVAVRLKGVDAPEHRGKCPAEKYAAVAATARLDELVGDGAVRLTGISGGKYYGRVLADVSTSALGDLGGILQEEGLVARYEGGSRRDWCAGVLSGALDFFRSALPRTDEGRS